MILKNSTTVHFQSETEEQSPKMVPTQFGCLANNDQINTGHLRFDSSFFFFFFFLSLSLSKTLAHLLNHNETNSKIRNHSCPLTAGVQWSRCNFWLENKLTFLCKHGDLQMWMASDYEAELIFTQISLNTALHLFI